MLTTQGKNNFTMENLSIHHFNQLIKVNIISNGTNQSQVPPNRMHQEENGITFEDIPAKDA